MNLDDIKVRLLELNEQIEYFDAQINDAIKAKDWTLRNSYLDKCEILEAEYDHLNKNLQYEQAIQDMSDWYDDEKNRDTYNERIVSMYCDN
jgi:hypothetical protein